ncbi:tellurium resistance protein TerC [Chryseobacterium sp. POL2]|uniref:MauE/DoxX family redox-associated membrane protein n=1 Tax=Chryseobacterium sp. POL2 TaxID=2713414 RepID=UPI0013E16C03|nr:MauE/DoxX family redox-associated membrane protein [Chryseobacterium sp. POL2]QIG90360.1 tellurium resistance protein TerC [Chryseobacterium sp. POL2]
MRNFKQTIINITTSFLMLLFCYAAISKILDFENFQVQIAQSPLLSAYAGFVSYSVIIAELLIVALLMIPKARPAGLYASFGLMLAFTVYIYLILNYSDFVPCSCGGILEKMGWTEHLIFNTACVLLTLYAIMAQHKLKIEKSQIDEIKERRMLKRSRIWLATKLSIVTLLSSTLVISMFFSSEYIIKKENNFTRRFIPHGAILNTTYNLKIDSYYIIGIFKDNVILGNITTPLVLYTLNTKTTKIKKLIIKPDYINLPFKKLQLSTNPPFYYLYDGTIPIIYRGNLGESKVNTISYKNGYFNQLINIDSLNFVLRTQSRQNQAYTLATLHIDSLPQIELKSNILEKQSDGVFDVDGNILIDNRNKKIVYVYYYRNNFLVTDKNLQNIQRYNTISISTITTVKSKKLSNGLSKMVSPPPKVNGKSSVNNGTICIQSYLRGRHESKKQWANSFVIDFYSILQQEYLGSIYIAKPTKNSTIKSIQLQNKYLYIIVDRQLFRYHFVDRMIKKINKGEAENLTKSRQN